MPLTPEQLAKQRAEALRKANSVRSHRAQVKRRLHSGNVSLAEALVDPLLGTMKVGDLLCELPRSGPAHARRWLAFAHVAWDKPLEKLTDRQRAELAEITPKPKGTE